MITTALTPEVVQAAALRLAVQKKYGGLKVPDFWESQGRSSIRTQSGVIPFIPFRWQREFIDSITRRELVLKSRDVGSSEICVRFFCWKAMKEGGNVLIKADKHENAKNLIAMAKQYLMSLPSKERPTLTTDNETELELLTGITIKALARGGGRSERCKYLLLTERAFWEDSAEEVADVSGALVAEGWQIVESTANGFNEFHALWMDDANGYRRTFVNRLDNPTHTDRWWRDKQTEMAASVELLPREYPLTAHEAFVASGLTVFEKESILASREKCIKPIEVRENGLVKVWAKPIPGRRYVAGADVAEGKDIGNQRLDCSGVAIYDAASLEHVADLHGQMPLDIFPRMADQLCREYNNALLGVERNNHGHAVLLVLRALNYPNLYQHTDETTIKAGQHPRAELGWPATSVTKPILEAELGTLIKAQAIKSYDVAFWDECLSYVHLGTGKTGGQSSCHDDRVIKHAIAVMMRKQQPAATSIQSLAPKWIGIPSGAEKRETGFDRARKAKQKERAKARRAQGFDV